MPLEWNLMSYRMYTAPQIFTNTFVYHTITDGNKSFNKLLKQFMYRLHSQTSNMTKQCAVTKPTRVLRPTTNTRTHS